jgi:hypothetical protein
MESFLVQKSVANVVRAGNIEQSCVSIFSDLSNIEMYVPNINKILRLVLSVPEINC